MKKVQEVETDIEVANSKPRKETFCTRWFDEHAVNDKTFLRQVCECTSKQMLRQFDIHAGKNNPEPFGVIFYGTFMVILKFLKGKQKKYNNFTIQIGKSLNIGFTNEIDDDEEKLGNFLPVMEYVGLG